MIIERIGKLILVRHGQTVKWANKKSRTPWFADDDEMMRCGPWKDSEVYLTDTGRRQARRAGKMLKKFLKGVPDYFFCSTFLRTRQTLEEILKAFTAKEKRCSDIVFKDMIRERDYGYFGRLTAVEINEHFPWWPTRAFSGTDPLVIPVGGESIMSMCEGRIRNFLLELKELAAAGNPDKTVVIVAHARVIACIRYLLESWDFRRLEDELDGFPPPASMTVYEFRAGYPVLKILNNKKV